MTVAGQLAAFLQALKEALQNGRRPDEKGREARFVCS